MAAAFAAFPGTAGGTIAGPASFHYRRNLVPGKNFLFYPVRIFDYIKIHHAAGSLGGRRRHRSSTILRPPFVPPVLFAYECIPGIIFYSPGTDHDRTVL